MLTQTYVIITLLNVLLAGTTKATFDINPNQLQMVADHLTQEECRKLSESLHEDGYLNSHNPTGTAEPKGVSCLRLLEHWNTHEGKRQSFHQLALRLRQLGKKDVADRLAKSVSSEKIAEVQESFLSDPFKSRIHTNSPLLQESPHVETPESEPEVVQHWTAFETIVAVFLSLMGALLLFIICMYFLKCFLPDSFARMRASFYLSFTGKRPDEENLYFSL